MFDRYRNCRSSRIYHFVSREAISSSGEAILRSHLVSRSRHRRSFSFHSIEPVLLKRLSQAHRLIIPHKQLGHRRTMSSQPKLDTYPLARGVIDSVRLNLCHFIWKKSFPWVVHPSVSLEGRQNLRIADVGCGTGLVFRYSV